MGLAVLQWTCRDFPCMALLLLLAQLIDFVIQAVLETPIMQETYGFLNEKGGEYDQER